MYYHAFTPGFNWWYVVGPVFLVLSFVIGWAIPRVCRKQNGRLGLNMVFNERFGHFTAGLFSLIWGVLVFVESIAGVIQYFDNTILTARDSGAWSMVFAVCAIMALVFVVGVLYDSAYQMGRNAKRRKLIARYNLRKRSDGSEIRIVTTRMDLPMNNRRNDYVGM